MWDKIKQWICQDCLIKNESLRQENAILSSSEDILTNENKSLRRENNKLSSSIEEVQLELSNTVEKLNRREKEEKLELYWNTKREATNSYRYNGRVFENNRIPIDVRIFFTDYNNLLPSFTSGTNDEKAYNALRWVIQYIRYTTDAKQFDSAEHWLFPFETLQSRKGDCEDGGIVLANIMLNSGIPYWRIRLNAGDVKGGGHCWVTYLRESDNKWVVLDWCYWSKDSIEGLLWEDAENYFDIWFSWNIKHIFARDMLDREE